MRSKVADINQSGNVSKPFLCYSSKSQRDPSSSNGDPEEQRNLPTIVTLRRPSRRSLNNPEQHLKNRWPQLRSEFMTLQSGRDRTNTASWEKTTTDQRPISHLPEHILMILETFETELSGRCPITSGAKRMQRSRKSVTPTVRHGGGSVMVWGCFRTWTCCGCKQDEGPSPDWTPVETLCLRQDVHAPKPLV